MSLELIHGLYDYHRWANRRLFAVTVLLGEDAAGRKIGSHFSYPTLRRMFTHVYGADWLWLNRWKGGSPTPLSPSSIPSLAELRERWDALEKEQQAFLDALTEADLGRLVDYKNIDGKAYRVPLGPLLHHVPNHATHHRSEIATMLTMVSGSPPDTGRATYELVKSGQLTP
jgi:uncharacterized damage-inducible protein DinB